MCGFFVNVSNTELSKESVNEIISSLYSRGPDKQKYLSFETASNYKVDMIHTRLEILGLGDCGSQPMENEKYIILFNGEIYNYKNLISYLGKDYCDCGDTKVVLDLITKYGIEFCLNLFKGMFSIIILDKNKESIYLLRDGFGTKPLYIYNDNKKILLSSNISAIRKSCINKEIGKLTKMGEIFFLLFGFVYISRETTKGISEANPGVLYKIDINNLKIKTVFKKVNQDYKIHDFNWQKEIIDSFNADVPLSLLLSGGVDSTFLACLSRKIKRKNNRFIKAFTLSNETGSNLEDVLNAKKTSRILKFKHQIINVKRTDIENMINSYVAAMEYPTDDGLNIFCATKKIFSNNIKVCLTGLGGDEFFGGYGTSNNSFIKMFLRNSFLWKYFPFLRKFFINKGYGGYLKKNIIDPSSIEGYLYGKAFIFDNMPIDIVEKSIKNFSYFLENRLPKNFASQYNKKNKISLLELHGYCIPQLVKDSDTFGMSNSIEVRPSLLVDSLLKRLLQNKNSNFTKKTLRSRIDNDISINLNSKKRGFTVDIKEYLIMNIEEITSKIFIFDDNFIYKYIIDKFRESFKNKSRLNERIYYFIWRLYILSMWKSLNN